MREAEPLPSIPGPDGESLPALPPEAERDSAPPWEKLEAGRYMPRRIRGSCKGRVLG